MVLSHSSFIIAVRRIVSAACLLTFALILLGCSGLTTSELSQPLSGASLSVTPGNISFNSTVVGNTLAQPLTLSNTGKVPVKISSLTLSNKEFAISGPSVPLTILPATSQSYSLSFTPTSSGKTTASLSIKSDATKTPISVQLAGTGQKVIAAAQISPVSINFGNIQLQTTSTQNVTLQNTGDVAFTISGVTVVGSGFGYSDLSPGYSLPPNQTVSFQVWYRPTVAGAASGTLAILSANLPSPAEMSVSGDGVSATTPTPSPTPAPVQHTVQLTWNASTSSVVGYRVYRSETSGSSYTSLTGSTLNALTYNDSTVTSGSTYYYVVTAVDAAGVESVYSNQATAVIPSS